MANDLHELSKDIVGIVFKYETRLASDIIQFYLVNDGVNYIKIEFSGRYNLKIIEVVNDVATVIFASSNGSNEGPERFIFNTQIWWDNRDQRLYVYDDYRNGRYLDSTAIPTNGDLNSFGFLHKSVYGNARFINYRAELK